jgi:hypothetical protein
MCGDRSHVMNWMTQGQTKRGSPSASGGRQMVGPGSRNLLSLWEWMSLTPPLPWQEVGRKRGEWAIVGPPRMGARL